MPDSLAFRRARRRGSIRSSDLPAAEEIWRTLAREHAAALPHLVLLGRVGRQLPHLLQHPSERDAFVEALRRSAIAETLYQDDPAHAGMRQMVEHLLRHLASDLPHLVAVQSESFFDPRLLFAGIRPEVLAEFDRLRADAVALGKLKVPAWRADTMRTEFAFLNGIGEDKLGVHRFNPYRAIAAGSDVPSLASYLKRLGYRTVCIHPYPASFYQRDRVFPGLGFDEFLDVRAFDDTMRFGPYIGDAAVADKVAALLREATGPLFVFVITMENHGPLHLKRVAPADVDALYSVPPPDGCDDLTIYLRHLRNADQMIAKLLQALDRCERPASLCWFGDHVPLMPSVYEPFGVPNGEVEYVIWSNQNSARPCAVDLVANDLPMAWLLGGRVILEDIARY